tara:strand:+ start:58 stop:417 length:360 start_codon:yes stop_codon:yes gene_type:complete
MEMNNMAEQLELPFGDDVSLGSRRIKKLFGRAEILDTAKKYVTQDRAAEHGNMEDNFSTIASYWSEHLDTKITAIDVAVMMALLKVARVKSNPHHVDNFVDGCGYLGCGGELACGKGED